MHSWWTKAMALGAAAGFILLAASPASAQGSSSTATPIQHVVVIFQENVSYDHYFGTYPLAAPNNDGTVYFGAPSSSTPHANGLNPALLKNNPNLANPFRIDHSVPVTCDEDHNYGDEQAAADGGLMDKFVQKLSCNDRVLGPASTMGYYDGNTVTALWNYAQHFAMNDNFFGTTFGPPPPEQSISSQVRPTESAAATIPIPLTSSPDPSSVTPTPSMTIAAAKPSSACPARTSETSSTPKALHGDSSRAV